MVYYEERQDLLMDSMQSSEEKKKVKNPNRQQSFGPSD